MQINFAEYFSPDRLRLIIFPTEKCNFRCSYCYEDFAVGRMPADICQGVVALVNSRRNNLRSLEIDWFGGEPLVAVDVIYLVGAKIFEICSSHQITLTSSITTNGYLLSPSIWRELLARGIKRFQISLDGPPSIHDRQRKMASGAPTFDTIVSNITGLLSSSDDFKLTLRIHYEPRTITSVRQFLVDDVSRWAADSRVEVLFAHIDNIASDQAAHVPQMSRSERAQVLDDFSHLVPRTKTRHRDLIGDPYVCYAAQPNSFVIRADGRVGKCTVALKDESNIVGSLTSDGRLLIDNEKARHWLAGWASGDQATLSCPYSTMKTVQLEAAASPTSHRQAGEILTQILPATAIS